MQKFVLLKLLYYFNVSSFIIRQKITVKAQVLELLDPLSGGAII
jgi:uncharacterized membrane protein